MYGRKSAPAIVRVGEVSAYPLSLPVHGIVEQTL